MTAKNWIARFGCLLDKKPSRQYGIMYDAPIDAIRAEIAADDPVKQACDARSMAKAVSFRKTHGRERAILARGVVRRRRPAADAKREQRGVKPPGSLLFIILVIVIVFIVVVGLSGGVMLPVALVVPELAIDAVDRKQLRMRAPFDRLAA
jgi:hypothetical protein